MCFKLMQNNDYRDKFAFIIEFLTAAFTFFTATMTGRDFDMLDGAPLSHIVPPDGSSALGKGVTVLSAILNAPKPPSLSELADATDLPRPTVFRVVKQLEDTLLVTRTPGGDKYVVGPNLMALATDAMSSFARIAPVRAILNALVAEIGETCNLGVLDRDGVIYVERVECAWPLRLQIGVGTRVPLHATAIGKLLLAHLPARTRKRILCAGPLQRFTENTLTERSALEAHFKQIRRLGYASNDQENTAGLVGIAVPVFDSKGRVFAGLSVHAPAARMTIPTAVTKLDRFKAAAQQIERAMRDYDVPIDTTPSQKGPPT